jgi:hypothetical protein
MSDKFCKDCKHSRSDRRQFAPMRMCSHPSLGVDLVEGTRNDQPCVDMRRAYADCGVNARLFEPLISDELLKAMGERS